MRRSSGALRHLVVDEGVVEADRRRLVARVGVDDPREARPIGGGEAHRAGLAARIERRALEREGVDRAAGAADRDDLGMGGRVVRGGDLVPALGEQACRGGRSRPRTGRPRRPAMCSRESATARARWRRSSGERRHAGRPSDADRQSAERGSAMTLALGEELGRDGGRDDGGLLAARCRGRPIGQASACDRARAMPSARKRFSKRARFVVDCRSGRRRGTARRERRGRDGEVERMLDASSRARRRQVALWRSRRPDLPCRIGHDIGGDVRREGVVPAIDPARPRRAAAPAPGRARARHGRRRRGASVRAALLAGSGRGKSRQVVRHRRRRRSRSAASRVRRSIGRGRGREPAR